MEEKIIIKSVLYSKKELAKMIYLWFWVGVFIGVAFLAFKTALNAYKAWEACPRLDLYSSGYKYLLSELYAFASSMVNPLLYVLVVSLILFFVSYYFYSRKSLTVSENYVTVYALL